MPVGLSPAVTPTIKSKSIAISASYSNLSMFSSSAKADQRASCDQENFFHLKCSALNRRIIENRDTSKFWEPLP
jgi:hypothetical protein